MKNNRKILIWITAAILIVAAVFGIWHASGAGGRGQNRNAGKTIHVERTDWNDEVKAAVNDLLEL